MALDFLPVDRDQRFLLPADMREWLPADHEALFVVDVVAAMDLSAFEAAYRLGGAGRRAYHPTMMVALLLYAYSQGVESSRSIERACRESVAYRVVCANHLPDHSAVARFRALHESRLHVLFVQALAMCEAAGLVRLGLIAIDGTKISANAALDANRTAAGIEAEVAEMLARHRRNDEADDARLGEARGDELPPAMADPTGRLERLRAAKRRAEEMAAQRVHPQRGTVQANVTDPDSARVQEAFGGTLQGYNAQLIVGEGQLILATDVTNEASDYHQLDPMLQAVKENLAAAQVSQAPETVVADAGYASEQNLTQPDHGPERLIATRNRRSSCTGEDPAEVRRLYDEACQAHEAELARMAEEDQVERRRRAAVFERIASGELTYAQAAAELGLSVCPTFMGCKAWRGGGLDAVPIRRRPRPPAPPAPSTFSELRWAMEARLATPEGRERYRQRSPLVEGTISQLKRRGEVRRFLRRGLPAVRSEWGLRATAHNLRKLRLVAAAPL